MTTLRYRYRIYPTPDQRTMLARTFGCARVVWNDELARAKDSETQYDGFAKASRRLTESKTTEERSWLRDVSCVPLQQALRHLDSAFRRFFDGLKKKGPRVGFPSFKKKNGPQSAEFTRNAFAIHNGKLRLTKIGAVKVMWSRNLPSDPKTATVTLDPTGRYHVSFTVEKEDVPFTGGLPIGIDLGIKSFAALSDGAVVHAPDYRRLERYIEKAQRVLSRREKGSARRERARLRVAKLQARLADLRGDFLAKTSTWLVRTYSSISLEDLNVSGMVKNHHLARAISRQGWRKFRTLIEEKCVRYGRGFQLVNRWEPTSQVCSECGHRWGRLDLNVRRVTCESCGAVHDRDVNAAKNIVAAGQVETQNGRGEHVRRSASSGAGAVLVEASTAGVVAGIHGL